MLRAILNSAGYTVVGEANSGASGLDLVLKLQPHIVCLDISMPDSDGIDVLQQIMEKLPQCVVLMVTAKHDITTVQRAVQNGAKGFVIKPFNTSTILNTIKNAVNRSASAR